jgi:tetratricopeptide (TPR) repeat protein
VSKQTSESSYTLRSIQEMLGISRGVITGLIGAGFVSPTRGSRNEYRFSFQDVVLLRTAYGLQAANIPSRKILRSLERLKSALPTDVPLTGLRITAVGNDVAVREGNAQRSAESGQLLIDFEVAPASDGASVTVLQRRPAQADPPLDDAAAWFAHGEDVEPEDKEAAEAAYRQALALAPDHADAYMNLGALLCDAGRCDEAVKLYDEALLHCPDAPAVHFNRAIALEDQGRSEEALVSYEACLALSPDLANAHFNAARLYQSAGNFQKALRHFNAYRRLTR